MTRVANPQLLPDMERLVGPLVYLTWTCPLCRARVWADEPDACSASWSG